MGDADSTLYERPGELLQQLLRFDTSNPPGNEAACVAYIERLLAGAGLETRVVARASDRPNLIARLPGAGNARPLLLHGHVDVVSTANQQWCYPPFAGEIVNGYVWGRGALDMKGGLAMLLAALLQARAEEITPPGDVVLAVLADEEAEGDFGARYLVERHPKLFAGIRYAISEFGGFSLYFGGKRFYPVQVSEKQRCWLRATVCPETPGGSSPTPTCSERRLNAFVTTLRASRLPVHVTPVAEAMIRAIASTLPLPLSVMARWLIHPRFTDHLLDLLGHRGARFDPLLHNAVDHREDKITVKNSTAVAEFSGRVLPGHSAEGMLTELRLLAADCIKLELLRQDPAPPAEPDMGLYPLLATILREADPTGIPIPLLLARGHTDARFFWRLGIQTYGWIPMRLPRELNFMQLIHSANERIPVDVLAFGTRAILKVLRRFGTAPQG
jgi:acetylornithine deacetylase/succinyl-diaminopimelate desuccinylase-like protein